MNNDRYTKFILTIIAIALLVNAFRNSTYTSHAQTGDVQKVAICDTQNQCANLFKTGPDWAPSYSLPVLNAQLP